MYSPKSNETLLSSQIQRINQNQPTEMDQNQIDASRF